MDTISAYILITLVAVSIGTFINDFDAPFDFACKNTQTISRVYSIHNNHAEDRRFDLTCRDVLPEDTMYPTCYWTDYVNNYDELVHFSCPTNHYMAGMGSVHNNHNEDRIFKFYCCKSEGVHELDCNFSGWVNGLDQPADFNVPAGSVMKGMISQHDNGAEDRRFDYETCKVAMLPDEVLVG